MNRQKRVYGVGSKIGLGRVTTDIVITDNLFKVSKET